VDIIQVGLLEISHAEATFKGKRLTLHPMEVRVLYELAHARGEPLTREEIHKRCWGTSGRPRNVDVTICRMRVRLEAETHLRIMSERARGYRLTAFEAEPEKPRQVSPDRRLLVVEDDHLMQRAYRRFLRQLGLEADFADSIEMAERLVRSRPYSAYLVDLGLRDGCGVRVIPTIQECDPRAPIMIISGREDDHALEYSEQYGVPYAFKPFDPKSLRRFVERTIYGA
jgi:DNA-binding response OmpR family regulator